MNYLSYHFGPRNTNLTERVFNVRLGRLRFYNDFPILRPSTTDDWGIIGKNPIFRVLRHFPLPIIGNLSPLYARERKRRFAAGTGKKAYPYLSCDITRKGGNTHVR